MRTRLGIATASAALLCAATTSVPAQQLIKYGTMLCTPSQPNQARSRLQCVFNSAVPGFVTETYTISHPTDIVSTPQQPVRLHWGALFRIKPRGELSFVGGFSEVPDDPLVAGLGPNALIGGVDNLMILQPIREQGNFALRITAIEFAFQP